jgi:hypothetical protein
MGKVMRSTCALAFAIGVSACSVKRITYHPLDDDVPDASQGDGGSVVDTLPPAALGTMENPARTCSELHAVGMPSAVYWVRIGDTGTPFEVYCEQQLNGGGWAMLVNSVRREDGTTTAFWQFTYAARLNQIGTLAADQNYYNGSLYLIGTEYMDVFVDLQDKTAIAAVVTAEGFDPETMRFIVPRLTSGSGPVFSAQFASGWSAPDFDGDTHSVNCAVAYNNVAQHYSECWAYNLGSDADAPLLDGGVGPHVHNPVLTALGLTLQPDSGTYSQVKRISRFIRW